MQYYEAKVKLSLGHKEKFSADLILIVKFSRFDTRRCVRSSLATNQELHEKALNEVTEPNLAIVGAEVQQCFAVRTFQDFQDLLATTLATTRQLIQSNWTQTLLFMKYCTIDL
jgi:hypothetical protein